MNERYIRWWTPHLSRDFEMLAVNSDQSDRKVVEQFVQTALSVADYAAVMTQGSIYRMGETTDITDAVSHAYMGAVG